MDTSFSPNPISTVQFIPVITYLNLLGDFLFCENFLNEIDQRKQIPIVNALYEYLERNYDNLSQNLKLIRSLLQGSDLYGELENEDIDEVFVNVMLDYIITSLVFDKYGNIYGFLANVFRGREQLKYYHISKTMKEELTNARFENEYGPSSSLSNLSISRIINDIIMPLFPVPSTDQNLLSLDYSFAQAGSLYLRLGRLSDSYYSLNEKFDYPEDENLFEQYIATGYFVQIHHYQKIDTPYSALRAFALPVLIRYITTEEKLNNVDIKNLINDPYHWKVAYDKFFQNVEEAFMEIETQLSNDYTYKMHQSFSYFQNRVLMAAVVLNTSCAHLDDSVRNNLLPYYMHYGEEIQCKDDEVLPNINAWFLSQIKNVGNVYETFDLNILGNFLNESPIGKLRGVIVYLVTPNNFNPSEHLSYDLLQFHDMSNNVSDYFALVWEKYTASLKCEIEDPEYFQKIIGPSRDDLVNTGKRIILKSANQSVDVFINEIVKHKKRRLEYFLTYSNTDDREWWKEFGLSLVPFYPCLENMDEKYVEVHKNLCAREDIHFLNKYSIVLPPIMDVSSRNLIKFYGTTERVVFLKEIILKVSDRLFNFSRKNTSPEEIAIVTNEFYNKLALDLVEPKFEFLSFRSKEMRFMQKVFSTLQTEITQSFESVNNMLDRISNLQSSSKIIINENINNSNQSLLVNSRNNITGFGYKFKYIDELNNKIKIVELRTGYELKEKIFISPSWDSSQGLKIHTKYDSTPNNSVIFISSTHNSSKIEELLLKIENGTLVPLNKTTQLIYEVNNQLWNTSIKSIFHGIATHDHNDDLCNFDDYLQTAGEVCFRHARSVDRYEKNKKITQLLWRNKFEENVILQNQIHDMLKMYFFETDTALFKFLSNWLKDNNFENSDWTKKNIKLKSQLLYKLLYEVYLNTRFISNLTAEYTINSSYTYKDRSIIEQGTTLETIVKDYTHQKSEYLVTFQDFYAKRNYATTGHMRITSDTMAATRYNGCFFFRNTSLRIGYENESVLSQIDKINL
ncbi:uncharacterized protein LOC122506145 isoform X2 [Leptopilina heterotoma]|uniref:uncharacterized protein LOC122506145 isoform X2 n=1 Tax=Leptopilina heterotoma TaxID=63436 RepID=UPI001CA9814A|nr:uncharacterized protein LOC122506145 isoform X2 [Leptopilina heterotoma]